MNIRSLLLGSVAAAGISTGAYAADLGVLTSLDVCDALGLSGLTISSDTNCLQISGSVSYEFVWGDYKGNGSDAGGVGSIQDARFADHRVGNVPGGNGRVTIAQPGFWQGAAPNGPAVNNDWSSKVEAWVKLVGSADTDFGRAQAIIVLRQVEQSVVVNERQGNAVNNFWGDTLNGTADSYVGGDNTALQLDQAYVSVGDSTVLMAGLRKRNATGSIGNFGDDKPLNFTGLVNSNKVEHGVLVADEAGGFGGHSIQIVSDLGNGVSVGAGLERLEGYNTASWANAPDGAQAAANNAANAGTAIGVISYKGDGITAHATGWALGVLDGNVDSYGFHVGATAVLDQVTVLGAAAYSYDTATLAYTFGALGSAQAKFDIFTVAVSAEVTNQTVGNPGYGVGGSFGANVTDGVAINVGGKWFRNGAGEDTAHGAAQIVASVTETIKLTGEVGVWYGSHSQAQAGAPAPTSVYYGAAEVAWTPGGANNFSSSLKGEVYSNGAYKATFKASKAFQ